MSQRSDQQFNKLLSNPLFEREELMLLAFARKTLTEERWLKGSVRKFDPLEEPDDEKDPICIQGALEEVMRTNNFSPYIKHKAETLINIACERSQYQRYNDDEDTSYADVQKLLTTAIALGLKEPELTKLVK